MVDTNLILDNEFVKSHVEFLNNIQGVLTDQKELIESLKEHDVLTRHILEAKNNTNKKVIEANGKIYLIGIDALIKETEDHMVPFINHVYKNRDIE